MLCLITNRRLCREPLPERVERVLSCGVKKVILREKDLADAELLPLAAEIKAICDRYGASLIVNSSVAVARQVDADGVQLPMECFRRLAGTAEWMDMQIGVSVHSLDEALEAKARGACRVLYGNIFETDCKPGLAGRGIDLLRQMMEQAGLPVWAVGGILPQNAGEVTRAGAETACVMSTLLQTEKVSQTVEAYRRALEAGKASLTP